MNIKQAIEILQQNKPTSDSRCCGKELCEACDVAISAMKELQLYKDGKLCLVPEDVYTSQCEELDAYKQLGILEEVREAVEKQSECKSCGYKTHSERISKLNNCNNCGSLNTCVKRPEYGDYCRINCYDWRVKE